MSSLRIDDARLAGVAISCPGSVAMGATATCTSAPYTISAADIARGGPLVNTAIARGISDGAPVASPAASASTPLGGAPMLRLVKTADATRPLRAGAAIRYSFEVTNTGPVAVTNLRVADPKLSGVTCPSSALDPGRSVRCTAAPYIVTAEDVRRGVLTNTATVTADGPGGTRATATDTVTIGDGTPRLALVKVARLVVDAGTPGAPDLHR